MKTIFTLLMLVVIWFAAPAQTLEGFFGFRFGSSVQLVKHGLAAKPDCVIDERNSTPNCIWIDKTQFAGREATLMLKFLDDQLYNGAAIFVPVTEGATIDLYERIVSELNAKYYKTDDVTEEFQHPYDRNDGYALSALKKGKAKLITAWTFNNDSKIKITINSNLQILLIYLDGPRFRIANRIEREKNNKDY